IGGAWDPGSWARLAEWIRRCDEPVPLPPPEDQATLMAWGGLARQAVSLRDRLGLCPWDPEAQPALAEALDRRARWLGDRPAWPGREAAAAGLARWLPVVDCAEALDLPWRGAGALRRLGEAVRQAAAAALPALADPVATCRHLAVLDALGSLHDLLGEDALGPGLAGRLQGIAAAMARLPCPAADTAGALDRSVLDRLRGLDRAGASALGLGTLGRGTLGEAEIPLLSAGLPALMLAQAAHRLPPLPTSLSGATPPGPDAARNTRWS
ncbi:hypothetical protein, partial [Paracraurococcus ruber]